MRLVPMEGERFTLSAEEAVKLCDENTIGVVAILGSTFDGSYEPVKEICAALDALEHESGLDIPVHVDGASGAMIAPFVDPDLEWDFRLPRVASINTSGHKYGLVYPGVGWIIWRDTEALHICGLKKNWSELLTTSSMVRAMNRFADLRRCSKGLLPSLTVGLPTRENFY